MFNLKNILSQEEMDYISEDFNDVLGESMWSVKFIHRVVLTDVFNPVTGVSTIGYSDVPSKGFLREYSAHEAAVSKDMIRVGDMQLTYTRSSALPRNKPDDRMLVEVTSASHIGLTNNSTAVIADTTAKFVDDGVQGGDILIIPTSSNEGVVRTVTNNENIILKTAWNDDSIGHTEYTIYRLYSVIGIDVDPLKLTVKAHIRRCGG